MRTELYKFTNPQKSIWLTEQYHPNTSINNVCGTLTLKEILNKELLEKAILLFISSNDSLKFKLNFSQNEPTQYVSDEVNYSVKYVEVNDEKEFNKVANDFAQKPFDIYNSFLFDFLIFKFKDNSKSGYIAKLHHLISDAWSMSLLIDEIIDIYSRLLSNSPINIENKIEKPSYLSYIESEKQYMNSDKYIKDKEFWTNLFEDTTPEITSLSKKYNNEFSIANPTKANRLTFTLSEKETNTIKKFCKDYKTSPYAFFMAVLGLYTGKMNNTNNIILGTPVLNRTNFKEKHTIGMFISTIPFKMNIDFNNNFIEFLSTIGTTQLNYFRHQKFPYNNLLEIIREKHDISSNLYTTVLSYQNAKNNRKNSDISYDTVWNFNGNISEELEIHISDLDDNNAFDLIFDYNISKFDKEEIIELKNRLLFIVSQVLDDPSIILNEIEIIIPEEKNAFLNTFNNTYTEYPKDKNILEIFYNNVIEHPTQKAVVYENNSITYEELYKKVCAIENELIKNKINFQEIVAINMPKSIDFVASILAVLRLGAIYLPISYDYPIDRIKYMIKNSRTKLILTNTENNNFSDDVLTICTNKISYEDIKILPPKHFDISNSAYVIYTSGSTGNPKGVEVSHKSLINHIYSVYNKYSTNFSTKDLTLSLVNISFDVNVDEIFIPMFFGCTLHLISDDSIYEPQKIANYIHDNNITYTFIPPTILDEVYNFLKVFNDLKLNKLLVGVQAIKNTILNKYLELMPKLEILNAYGPTEATIYCTSRNYNKIIDDKTFYVPIGKPMENCEIHILNNSLSLQPFGYIGEICISGECLAKGYLFNKEKTDTSFIYCKSLNKKLYRTGDYGYYLPNGEIMYVGRIDLQVKLNGYRIELSEIDTTVSKFSNNILNSISLIYKKKIYTFFIGKNVDTVSLKQFLKTKLPYYMIPVKFIEIEKIPSTKNGKVDNFLLITLLEEHIMKEKKNIILHSNKMEESLLNIFAEVLNISKNEISILDNFFELGGDSLSAIKVCTSIEKNLKKSLPIKKLFELDTIQDISNYLIRENNSSKYVINKVTEDLEKYPISSAQKRIYLSSQMAKEEKLLYNMPGIIKLPFDIDTTKLEFSINKLIEKHESLRTYFIKDSTGIYQKILPSTRLNLKESYINTEDFETYISEFPKEFDLSKAPLLRCEIINLDNNEKYLLIDIHHIISDGLSTNILINEISNFYQNDTALVESGLALSKKIFQNSPSPMDKNITYTDYALWENHCINNNLFSTEKNYWIDSLKNNEVLNLPTDFPKPTVNTYAGNKYRNVINESLFNKITDFCNTQNITIYMFLFGAFNILMHNFCRQENITIGTPIANRNIEGISNIIGMFVNTLAIHTEVNPSKTIKEFFTDFKTNIINSFENQVYPFNELNSDLKTKNLVNTIFTYQNSGIPKIKFDNFETTIKPIFTKISKFDLSIEITNTENKFEIIFEYCTDLFKESTIESLCNTYITILDNLTENGDLKISDIDLISLEEKENILYNFNNTSSKYPKNTDIYSLFLEYVQNTPDNMAIFFEETSFTYKELNDKICALAATLKNSGIGKNNIVAILLDKSIEAIIAMFATLKLGATFLPIDIDYPIERIDYMLTDSKAKILLTTNDFLNKPTIVIRTLNIALDNEVIYNADYEITTTARKINTDTPSHIIYTSGSTGKPKGTIIKQKGVLRLVKNTNYIDIRPDDKMLQAGSIGFDASTFEIFGALLNGLPLYIIKKENLLNSSSFQDFILRHKITLMLLTPSLLNQICEINPHIFNGVRILLTGGDVLSPKHINMLRTANPNLTIINAYGPTENTTISSTFTIDKYYKNNIPIGKPIANSSCFIVSNSNKLLPVGFPGELWVGGDGVAEGYLNNETLSSEKFIPNPFYAECKDTIYKTGDLVKWLPDGNIEFLGRIDSQVKIRGYRIELKEIDIKLGTYPNIKEAYSLVATIHNEKCICSYIATDIDIDVKDLQNFLKASLPKYMIPKYFVKLDKFPLNTNGKIDKTKLPSPIENEKEIKEIVLPKNETEKTFLEIFEKILNKTDISTTDDFFEIGGDSLGAMKIQIEALSKGIKIEYADIFTNSTVKDLAKIIEVKNTNVMATTKSYKPNNNEEKYLSYNSFLKNNTISNIKDVEYTPLGNVLLTGFTGFLGAHILDSFIKKEKGIIYCLIRDKDNLPALQRLKNTLNFYFENKYDKYIGNRIQLINGDIAYENLGLSSKDYKTLGKNITTIIHSAALVKHYGSFKEFEKINILGTERVVNFCTEFNLKLMHISTISVSGNVLADTGNVTHSFSEDRDYDETNFYIGQNIENVYINSKFKSEEIVLDAISNGLKAYILRMGNLTSRFSEGKFQQNHFENAFVNRIKSILQIGYAPDYLLNGYVEFTPIDFCGDAIIDLATHYNENYSVFHLLNDNHVPMKRLFEEMISIGIPLKTVSSKKFKNIINELLQDETKKTFLQGIINDFNENQELVYESNIKIKSDFTKQFLQKIGFDWPYIDSKYLKNYFKYLSDIGYFNINVV